MLYGRIELADDSVFALEINFVWKLKITRGNLKDSLLQKKKEKP